MLADNTDGTNVLGVSRDTPSYKSLEVHKQSQHSGDDHNDIPLCATFGKEQWMGLDVVLLNEFGFLVANDIVKTRIPMNVLMLTPLVMMMLAFAS